MARAALRSWLRKVQHQVAQPSRPQQRRIERVEAIGCGQNDDVATIFQAIQLGHEGVQHAVIDAMHRFAAAARPMASISSQNMTTGTSGSAAAASRATRKISR